jgi:hypothetical protein
VSKEHDDKFPQKPLKHSIRQMTSAFMLSSEVDEPKDGKNVAITIETLHNLAPIVRRLLERLEGH